MLHKPRLHLRGCRFRLRPILSKSYPRPRCCHEKVISRAICRYRMSDLTSNRGGRLSPGCPFLAEIVPTRRIRPVFDNTRSQTKAVRGVDAKCQHTRTPRSCARSDLATIDSEPGANVRWNTGSKFLQQSSYLVVQVSSVERMNSKEEAVTSHLQAAYDVLLHAGTLQVSC